MLESGFRWYFVSESSGELWKGQYNSTLDEKGRIVFPLRLRSEIPESIVVITHGYDNCLWIFSLAEWQRFSAGVTQSTTQINTRNLAIKRNLLAPAQEVEIDRNGRLSIPQPLRDYAELAKECVIHSIRAQMLELWDASKYKAYLEQSKPVLEEAMISLDF
jgi:MraZ protein